MAALATMANRPAPLPWKNGICSWCWNPDLSGIHSLRKADLLLPSGRITVYIEDSNEYDLICWKTDMLERTPEQYRRIEGDQIFVDKSAILNACLYGTG